MIEACNTMELFLYSINIVLRDRGDFSFHEWPSGRINTFTFKDLLIVHNICIKVYFFFDTPTVRPRRPVVLVC